VETKAGKTRVVKTKRRRNKGRSREEMRRESRKTEKKAKKRKDNRSEESGKRMGDLGQRERGGEIESKDEEAGSRKVP